MSRNKSYAQRRQEKQQRAEKDSWTTMHICPVAQVESVLGLLKHTSDKGMHIPLVVSHPEGDVLEITGVFSFIKNLTDEALFRMPSEYRGWHPFVVEKAGDNLGYFQPHPLAVIRCGALLMYAPWANPQLPIKYRDKCKELFPDKAYVFEMEGITGDFANDHKFFVAAIEGNGPKRSTALTVVKATDLMDEVKKEKETTRVNSLVSIFRDFAKDSFHSAILAVKITSGSTEAKLVILNKPDEKTIQNLFDENGIPFGIVRIWAKQSADGERRISAEGVPLNELTVPGVSNDWLKAQLRNCVNTMYEAVGQHLVSKGQAVEHTGAPNAN